MATLGRTFLSLSDIYKRSEDPYGMQVAQIIEMLNESNPVCKDMWATECNLGTTHRHTIRTGLPSVTWGQLYKGVAQSKSETQQVDDTTGFAEALSTVDKRVVDLAPNPAALRLSESAPFLESLAQEIETAFFYHDSASDPLKPKGMAARYGTIGGGGAGNQIVDGGGTGSDNTSIWFVTWGDNDTCALYPKGTKAGIDRDDKGEQRVLDGSSNPYYVMEEMFRWHIGFAVKDWRNNARIANIDVSDLQAGSVDVYDLMISAYYKLHRRRAPKIDGQMSTGRTMIYMNRTVMEAMDKANVNKGSSDNYVRLQPMQLDGEEVQSWRGIPIRETDAILNTEAQVT